MVKGTVRMLVVGNKPHLVTAYPESETVWVAIGILDGKRVEARETTEEAAFERWLDVVADQGD
jgi:hypothetical protein